jgi:hypothetical protein
MSETDSVESNEVNTTIQENQELNVPLQTKPFEITFQFESLSFMFFFYFLLIIILFISFKVLFRIYRIFNQLNHIIRLINSILFKMDSYHNKPSESEPKIDNKENNKLFDDINNILKMINHIEEKFN